MVSLALVAAVHAGIAVVGILWVYGYKVLTLGTPQNFSEVRENIGMIMWPQLLLQTIAWMVVAAVVGTALYSFVTFVAAVI
jgi:hypothetical protein